MGPAFRDRYQLIIVSISFCFFGAQQNFSTVKLTCLKQGFMVSVIAKMLAKLIVTSDYGIYP